MAGALSTGTVTFLVSRIEASTRLLQHPGETHAQVLVGGVKDVAEEVCARSTSPRKQRETVLNAGPLSIRKVTGIRRTSAKKRMTFCRSISIGEYGRNASARCLHANQIAAPLVFCGTRLSRVVR